MAAVSGASRAAGGWGRREATACHTVRAVLSAWSVAAASRLPAASAALSARCSARRKLVMADCTPCSRGSAASASASVSWLPECVDAAGTSAASATACAAARSRSVTRLWPGCEAAVAGTGTTCLSCVVSTNSLLWLKEVEASGAAAAAAAALACAASRVACSSWSCTSARRTSAAVHLDDAAASASWLSLRAPCNSRFVLRAASSRADKLSAAAMRAVASAAALRAADTASAASSCSLARSPWLSLSCRPASAARPAQRRHSRSASCRALRSCASDATSSLQRASNASVSRRRCSRRPASDRSSDRTRSSRSPAASNCTAREASRWDAATAAAVSSLTSAPRTSRAGVAVMATAREGDMNRGRPSPGPEPASYRARWGVLVGVMATEVECPPAAYVEAAAVTTRSRSSRWLLRFLAASNAARRPPTSRASDRRSSSAAARLACKSCTSRRSATAPACMAASSRDKEALVADADSFADCAAASCSPREVSAASARARRLSKDATCSCSSCCVAMATAASPCAASAASSACAERPASAPTRARRVDTSPTKCRSRSLPSSTCPSSTLTSARRPAASAARR